MRTARKYRMDAELTPSRLPAGDVQDQVGADPEQEADHDSGQHHVAAHPLGGGVPELAHDEQDRARGESEEGQLKRLGGNAEADDRADESLPAANQART